jgi:hypothetical protein
MAVLLYMRSGMDNSETVKQIEEVLLMLDSGNKLGCITILEEWTSVIDGMRERLNNENTANDKCI